MRGGEKRKKLRGGRGDASFSVQADDETGEVDDEEDGEALMI